MMILLLFLAIVEYLIYIFCLRSAWDRGEEGGGSYLKFAWIVYFLLVFRLPPANSVGVTCGACCCCWCGCNILYVWPVSAILLSIAAKIAHEHENLPRTDRRVALWDWSSLRARICRTVWKRNFNTAIKKQQQQQQDEAEKWNNNNKRFLPV